MENLQERAQSMVCQSCGMPIERAEQRGTTAAGTASSDYCSFCYQSGHFTDPHLTKEQMIAKSASFLISNEHMNEPAALAYARRTVSGLKRWLDGTAL